MPPPALSIEKGSFIDCTVHQVLLLIITRFVNWGEKPLADPALPNSQIMLEAMLTVKYLFFHCSAGSPETGRGQAVKIVDCCTGSLLNDWMSILHINIFYFPFE